MSALSIRSAWLRTWVAAAIAGAIAWQISPDDGWPELSAAWLVPSTLWLICARWCVLGYSRLAFAAELRSLRRRANRRLVPYNEERFHLLASARYPNGAAIVAESRKLTEELERDAARRRLRLLEAGIDLPARW